MSCPLTLHTLYSMPLLVPLPAAAGSLFPSRPSYHPFPSVPVNLHVFTIPLPSPVPRPPSLQPPMRRAWRGEGKANFKRDWKSVGACISSFFPHPEYFPPSCIITDNAVFLRSFFSCAFAPSYNHAYSPSSCIHSSPFPSCRLCPTIARHVSLGLALL